MKNITKKAPAKIKPFTNTMREKGLSAYHSGATADDDKAAFFKAIKPRVSLDQVSQYRPEFRAIAIHYYAQSTGLGKALLEELANPTLKETGKMKGCPQTIRSIKNCISVMTGRWVKAYKAYLKTDIVDGRAAGATKKKRATKGAVKPKQNDTVELNQAPDSTPIKRAIETVSSIPRMILVDTNWDAANEGLRQSIEEKATELVALLEQVK